MKSRWKMARKQSVSNGKILTQSLNACGRNKEQIKEKLDQGQGLPGVLLIRRWTVVMNGVVAECPQGMRPGGKILADFEIVQCSVDEVVEALSLGIIPEFFLAGALNDAAASDHGIPGNTHDAFQIVQLDVEIGWQLVCGGPLQGAFGKLPFDGVMGVENDAAFLGVNKITRRLVCRNPAVEKNGKGTEAVEEPDMGIDILCNRIAEEYFFGTQSQHAGLLTVTAGRKNTDQGSRRAPFSMTTTDHNLLCFRCGIEDVEICNGVAVRTGPVLNFMEDHNEGKL